MVKKYSVYVVQETAKEKDMAKIMEIDMAKTMEMEMEKGREVKELPNEEKQTVHESPLLTTKEVCKQLNMSWNSVQKHFFHLEEFPKKKIGNKWLYHRKELESFLDKYYDRF